MQKIIIYCDGGCRGNQHAENIGGWGAVLEYKGKTKELFGGEQNTTNNRMELTACIKALEAIKTKNIPIEMRVDSAYVCNGMTSWVEKWVKKNWKKSDGKPVENESLWQRLLLLSDNQESVEWSKVKGHSGESGNELADQLANKAMDEIGG
ncbi:ribonuclease HI [Halobacillus rhizosphaerae]|uniref:ribonuclease HI n=1 Tax=Halobacillus rhizosphaerae TaxID=3064889 RepID=UPI00398B0882